LLKARDTRTQLAALDSLAGLGPEARSAVAAIRAVRHAPPDDVNPDVRAAAASALEKITSTH
jgi:hypothetical protein